MVSKNLISPYNDKIATLTLPIKALLALNAILPIIERIGRDDALIAVSRGLQVSVAAKVVVATRLLQALLNLFARAITSVNSMLLCQFG